MTLPHFTSRTRETYREDHGTPEEVIALVHRVFGGIDLDLCSSAEHNSAIQASAYYSKENPCPVNARAGRIWCNPPGPLPTIKYFWRVWADAIDQGALGAFLVFNIDHFRQLPMPEGLTALFFRKRLKFRGCESSAAHASVLISTNDPECFSEYGTVVKT